MAVDKKGEENRSEGKKEEVKVIIGYNISFHLPPHNTLSPTKSEHPWRKEAEENQTEHTLELGFINVWK